MSHRRGLLAVKPHALAVKTYFDDASVQLRLSPNNYPNHVLKRAIKNVIIQAHFA